MSKKWLILDAMGVVFEIGQTITELLIPILTEKNNNISVDHVKELYYKAKLGKISTLKFWQSLGFNEEYLFIEREYLNKIAIDPDFIGVVKELKEIYSMAMLSNDVEEWSLYVQSKYKLNEIFDVIVISGTYGFSKPDKRIFNILLEKINTQPENCIFVDDQLKNISSASELGFKTIRFIRSTEKTPFCSEFEIKSFIELKKVLANFYM